MAASLEIPRSTSQVRSISLPSRSDALRVSIEDQLVRLRASETSASCSVSPICQKLIGIKDLYEQLNDMIQLPLNQQVLTLDLHRNGVEDVLDGSLNLLDVCGTTIDVLSMMKNSVLELQSFLRRRSSIAAALAIDVSSYITSRKKIKKVVSKCLKNLQKAGNEKDGRLVPATRVLQDAEAACLSTLKSSLAYLLGEKAKSKVHGWSLVSKLMHSKPVAPAPMTDEDTNEVDMIDMTLCALERKKSSTDMKTVQQLLKQLETLHLAIQEFEDCLASISRCLVKTRVSLLNVLNY